MLGCFRTTNIFILSFITQHYQICVGGHRGVVTDIPVDQDDISLYTVAKWQHIMQKARFFLPTHHINLLLPALSASNCSLYFSSFLTLFFTHSPPLSRLFSQACTQIWRNWETTWGWPSTAMKCRRTWPWCLLLTM